MQVGGTGPAEEDVGGMAFVVTFPATSRISSIQVVKNEEVIKTTTLKSQTLEGLIARTPDYAFKAPRSFFFNKKKTHSEARWRAQFLAKIKEKLTERVSKIQMKLNSNYPTKAAPLLKSLITEIKQATFRDYEVNGDYWLTQQQVISELNSIIEELDDDERECRRRDSERRIHRHHGHEAEKDNSTNRRK